MMSMELVNLSIFINLTFVLLVQTKLSVLKIAVPVVVLAVAVAAWWMYSAAGPEPAGKCCTNDKSCPKYDSCRK